MNKFLKKKKIKIDKKYKRIYNILNPGEKKMYAIQLRKTKDLLEFGSSLSMTGKIRFKKTQNPKLFKTEEEANEWIDLIAMCYAGIQKRNMKVIKATELCDLK